MPWFATSYRANWRAQHDVEEPVQVGAFGAHLWAMHARHATMVARWRGMGERVISDGFERAPYKPASSVLRSRAAATDKVHALCFLGQIALASGVATAQEVIGDEGFVHDFCHCGATKRLIARVSEIERRTPGYLPR